jgi:hypothetical protein
LRRPCSASDCSPRTYVAAHASLRRATKPSAWASSADATRAQVVAANGTPVASTARCAASRRGGSHTPISCAAAPRHSCSRVSDARITAKLPPATTTATAAAIPTRRHPRFGSRPSSRSSACMSG